MLSGSLQWRALRALPTQSLLWSALQPLPMQSLNWIAVQALLSASFGRINISRHRAAVARLYTLTPGNQSRQRSNSEVKTSSALLLASTGTDPSPVDNAALGAPLITLAEPPLVIRVELLPNNVFPAVEVELLVLANDAREPGALMGPKLVADPLLEVSVPPLEVNMLEIVEGESLLSGGLPAREAQVIVSFCRSDLRSSTLPSPAYCSCQPGWTVSKTHIRVSLMPMIRPNKTADILTLNRERHGFWTTGDGFTYTDFHQSMTSSAACIYVFQKRTDDSPLSQLGEQNVSGNGRDEIVYALSCGSGIPTRCLEIDLEVQSGKLMLERELDGPRKS
ncbi:hypothetical protein B0H13DRAFT_1862134 [Mycena leptocephala]|nr:hypothetical protein B0H13DRAFT_1862134 [Mycena leptocephala]